MLWGLKQTLTAFHADLALQRDEGSVIRRGDSMHGDMGTPSKGMQGLLLELPKPLDRRGFDGRSGYGACFSILLKLIPRTSSHCDQMPERDVDPSQRVHPAAHEQHQRQAPSAEARAGLFSIRRLGSGTNPEHGDVRIRSNRWGERGHRLLEGRLRRPSMTACTQFNAVASALSSPHLDPSLRRWCAVA